MRNSIFALLHCAWATHSELFRIAPHMKNGEVPESETVPEIPDSVANVPAGRLSEIRNALRRLDRAKVLETLRSRSVRIVVPSDSEYPSGFRQMGSAPFVLYLRGGFPSADVSVSVVGARKCTPYGESATRSFVRGFVRNGWAVVSGGAYGIDRIAHEAALENGGSTLAVIGCGIDVDYPVKHRGMFDAIAASHGSGVVSCFPLGAQPMGFHFPVRNALVAAYSKGTLVTEAAENSGSLITARLALEFNKEAFAVPWDVGRPTSAGTNALIRDGLAKCVISHADVFSELPGFPIAGTKPVSISDAPVASPPSEPILALLFSTGPVHPDVLSERLGIPSFELASELSKFELEGRVAVDAVGAYRFVQ